ncbi:MAG TPA: hypothetical protein V6D23_17130, partial [Candidatus Obscuribacterales bacterium]
MKDRSNPHRNSDSLMSNLPDCFCCTFALLEEVRLKRGKDRFSGLFAAYRFWRPPANRRLV